MKRLTALAIALTVIAFAAYAGPYFEVENVGLVLQPSLVVGWDFDAPFVDFTNLSIAGDFHVTYDSLLQTRSVVYPAPWSGGFDLGFAFANNEGRDVFEIGLGMDVGLLPTAWPTYVKLDKWETTIDIRGHPSSVVTVYGAIDLIYDVIAGPVGIWDFELTIGLECRWP